MDKYFFGVIFMKKIRLLCLTLAVCLLTCFAPFFSGGCASKQRLTEYDIAVTLNGNELVGSQTVQFYNNTQNSFSQLKFNLYPNAFSKQAKYKPISEQYYARAYYQGESYGHIEIIGVTQGNIALQHQISGQDNNVLLVELNKELFPEESVSVTIQFKTTLANVVARTGINKDAINLANFYPILCGIQDGAFYECLYYSTGDPFFSDVANYKVSLTYDSKYVVASSGKIVSSVDDGGKKTNTYSILSARSFAFVLSEKFETLCANVNGTQVNYYYYADDTPDKSLMAAVDAIKYFTATFGKYPYETYSVVQTEFIQGGMEFPALTMISDNLETRAYREVIIHETAHQWWQTVVGNNEIEYGFLDEGLVEYSVVLFFENHANYGFTREQLVESSRQTYKIYCSVYEKLFGETNTAMLRSLKDFTSEYEYVNIAYIKPVIMYDVLRQTIGDARFFNALSRYYNEYSMKNATPYDLVGIFEKCKADSNGFFESFFEGKAII